MFGRNLRGIVKHSWKLQITQDSVYFFIRVLCKLIENLMNEQISMMTLKMTFKKVIKFSSELFSSIVLMHTSECMKSVWDRKRIPTCWREKTFWKQKSNESAVVWRKSEKRIFEHTKKASIQILFIALPPFFLYPQISRKRFIRFYDSTSNNSIHPFNLPSQPPIYTRKGLEFERFCIHKMFANYDEFFCVHLRMYVRIINSESWSIERGRIFLLFHFS